MTLRRGNFHRERYFFFSNLETKRGHNGQGHGFGRTTPFFYLRNRKFYNAVLSKISSPVPPLYTVKSPRIEI